jgi:protein-tyrosine phosphatase
MGAGRGEEFQIFVICSGNRFRSPLVAAYLREATRELPVRVESAGTLDLGGLPPLEGAVVAAEEIGLDLTGHTSRFIGAVDLSGGDLVLGFERMHITTAVVDAGAKRERVFTLPEIVTLLERYEPPGIQNVVERARVAIAQADRGRGRDRRWRLSEIDDPIGTSAKTQRKTAADLIDLSDRLLAELFGRPAEHPVQRPWRERLRGRG